MGTGTVALLLALLSCVAAESHYVFTAPKVLSEGTAENVCLTVLDPPGPGRLVLQLQHTDDWHADPPASERDSWDEVITTVRADVDAKAGEDWQKCFPVRIVAHDSYRRGTTALVLTVNFNAHRYKIFGSRRVEVRNQKSGVPSETVYIQTDKALYKPGQKVLIRLLAVDEKLRPRTEPLSLVHVETPAGTRLAQWRDVKGTAGLSQLEFQLSDDPVLGDWKVKVEGAEGKYEKKFTVDEFVLPKFEVLIQGPPTIYADDRSAVLKVCGKYTHGKPVHGTANIVVEAKRYWRSVTRFEKEEHTDGDCAEFLVSARDLRLDDCDGPRSISVEASLTEDGTDVQLNATKKTFDVSRTELIFKADDDSQQYIKPGIPFTDQVRVTRADGSPTVGERVRVCFLTFKDDNKRRSWETVEPLEKICRIITSDSAGLARFAILLKSNDVSKVEIKAELPEGHDSHDDSGPSPPGGRDSSNRLLLPFPPGPPGPPGLPPRPPRRRCRDSDNSPSLTLTRKVWYSTSKAFVQIDTSVDTSGLTCGSKANFNVLFTGPRADSQRTLFYQVMGRGNVLLSESVQFDADENVDASELVDDRTLFGSEGTDGAAITSVALSISVTEGMSSGFKLLVYTVVDGEVIADSHSFKASSCLENQVSLQWSPSQAAPKDTVSLRLAASPGSFCGVDVVDKSVNLLSTTNRISLSEYFDKLKGLNLSPHSGPSQLDDRKYCKKKHGDPESPRDYYPKKSASSIIEPEPPLESPWGRPWYTWTTSFLDSLSAFDGRSWLVMSDLRTESRPCFRRNRPRPIPRPYHHWRRRGGSMRRKFSRPRARPGVAVANLVPAAPEFASAGGMPGPVGLAGATGGAPEGGSPPPAEEPQESRTYFPETWLFDMHAVGPDGVVTLNPETPDTITEWVAGAVCSNENTGMGVAPYASIKTFQPFFVTYTLPYSVKRGETVVLKVSILNYSGHQLPVRLTLFESEEFEILTPRVLTSCVDANTPEVLPFKLKPSALGEVNVTVVADVYPDLPQRCGPETVYGFSDSVIRPMLVEPEGFEREEIKSAFMCITPENQALSSSSDLKQLWLLETPLNLVPGSRRAYVSVVGELLGPSLENLENLVRQPTGCGEQNMVLFAPNIHVMKYLRATGDLTEDLKQKLVKHMNTGYQRELNYRHSDKSFSAFGKSDSSGSMWLTAFVVKSFGDAKQFIDIDRKDLSGSVQWIEDQQRSDGCFPSVGRVLHKEMKGGVSSSGEKGLTAYVTAALLNSGVGLRSDTISNAFRCLAEDGDRDDIYTLTLRTYARALNGETDVARSSMANIISKGIKEGGLLHWKAPGSKSNRALSVEIAAYNVLTMRILDNASGNGDYFVDSLSAVRWITKQRNSRGGFVSTQDTVLALEALAEFSLGLPRSESSDVTVRVVDRQHDLDERLHVTAQNRLLTQRLFVEEENLPAGLDITAEGTGCALVQAVYRYNVKDPAPSEAFTLSVKAAAKSGQKKCLKHSIDICTSYQGGEESNMAVVELEMISGFVPSKASLKALKKDSKLDLKRWEVDNNKVVFYFDALSADERCFSVQVVREQEVEDVKPAIVSVYDYYHTEQQISQTYELDVDCDNAPEEPIIIIDPPFIPDFEGRN